MFRKEKKTINFIHVNVNDYVYKHIRAFFRYLVVLLHSCVHNPLTFYDIFYSYQNSFNLAFINKKNLKNLNMF